MKRDDLSDIVAFYSKNGEGLRSQRNQLEFALTLGVFGALIPEDARVLEIGAGAGFFTAHLALAGHRVTAVELTPALLDENRRLIAELEKKSQKTLNVEFVQADARDLVGVPERQFDVILSQGPLYHLTELEDRVASMNASAQFAHEKTVFMSAVLHRIGFLGYLLKNQPGFVQSNESMVDEIMTHGHYLNHPRNGTFRGHYMDLAELVELHTEAGFELETVLTLDPCIGSNDEAFNSLEEPQKSAWIQYFLKRIADPQLLYTGRTWLALSHLKSASGSST
jgi:SAM-dependent methyltransferase